MDDLATTALVVEGGGMRGVFAAGILDAFLEASFDPFELYIGVSAGAGVLSNFVARQPGVSYHVFSALATQRRFFDPLRLLRGGHIMDLDWLWQARQQLRPFDYQTALQRTLNRPLLAVCTSVDSGEVRYMRPTLSNWANVIKASSALYPFYRGFVDVDGELLTDGSPSDPLPVLAAYNRGARRILVLRSQPAGHSGFGAAEQLYRYSFSRYPVLRRAMGHSRERYEGAEQIIAVPPSDAEIIQIAPAVPLATPQLTRRRESLAHDYHLGHLQGRLASSRLAHWQRQKQFAYDR